MRRIISTSTRKYGSSSGKSGLIGRQPKIAASTARIYEQTKFPWRPIVRIILLSMLVSGVVWALNSPIFLTRNTVIQGLKSIPEESVRAVLPKQSNIWLYPIRLTIKKVRATSPLVADIAIYRQAPSTVRLVIAEKVQAIDWVSSGQHYIVGLDGTVILQTESVLALPHLFDMANVTPTVGKAVVTAGFVHFVQELSRQYPLVFATEFDRMEIGETTFDVTVIPKSGPRIILDTNRPAEAQLKAAKIMLDQYQANIKEYVDLRVAGKGYYK